MLNEIKNNKFILLIILAVILLIVIIALGREKKEVKVPEVERQRVSIPPRRLPPRPVLEDTDFEEEVGKDLTIEEIKQLQMEELRDRVQTRSPSSRPGKYPTPAELEELEKSDSVLY